MVKNKQKKWRLLTWKRTAHTEEGAQTLGEGEL